MPGLKVLVPIGGWGAIASCSHCVEHANNLLREMSTAFHAEFGRNHKLFIMASGGDRAGLAPAALQCVCPDADRLFPSAQWQL